MVLDDVLGCLGVEFLFCNAGGTVGMASTVLVAGLLGTARWMAGGSWGTTGTVMFEWRSSRIGILLALPWLDEVAVSSEALSSCWNLNHVGVGFSALLTYHSFFTFPSFFAMSSLCLQILSFITCDGRIEMLDRSFIPNRISAGDGISLEIGVHL